jgi:3-phenylpropionate/trans-cinnamate dioxygenase ferredoxin reductase component
MSISMARRVMNNGHIVIVGAGQAGARAAEALRAGGFAGAVTLVGEEAEPPYERPALSKGVLLGTDAVEATYCLPRAFYDEKQVDLRLATRVEAIAPAAQRILLSSGEWLPYDKLLLCTGSRVRPLPGAPDIVGVHYLRTIADCRKLAPALKPGGRLVVVGGGFIGLEVVSTAAKRGMSVAVVERQGNLLERAVPHGIAAAVERMHRARGVTIHLGTAAAEILGEERVIGVRLTDGTTIPADAVVVGIGIIPNTELAEAAGAASDDGLIVDERGRARPHDARQRLCGRRRDEPSESDPWAPAAPGVLAECAESGDRGRAIHDRRRYALWRSAVVLVGSVRDEHPDGRSRCGRCDGPLARRP